LLYVIKTPRERRRTRTFNILNTNIRHITRSWTKQLPTFLTPTDPAHPSSSYSVLQVGVSTSTRFPHQYSAAHP